MPTAPKLSDWLSGQDPSYLACRDLKHDDVVATVRRTKYGFERIIACRRCDRFRIQTISKTGLLLKTSTRYPHGYLRPVGSGPLTAHDRAALRLRALAAQLKEVQS